MPNLATFTTDQAQQIDYLWKKIAYGVAKTDYSTNKSGSNETHASAIPVFTGNIWSQSSSIPSTPPVSSTSVVQVNSSVTCTSDATSTAGETWFTGLTNWIPDTFSATPGLYAVKVYKGSISGANLLSPNGSGNDDGYSFDYPSGILNFNGANIPSGITGSSTIIVVGYTYIGNTGLTGAGGGSQTMFFANVAAMQASSSVIAGDLCYVTDDGNGEFGLYLANANGPTTNFTLIATADSASEDAKTYTTTVNYNTTSPITLGSVNGQRSVQSVVVDVTVPFTTTGGGASNAILSVGDANSSNDLMDGTTQNDLTTTGNYIVNPCFVYPSNTSNLSLLVTYTAGNATAGSATVTVTFV